MEARLVSELELSELTQKARHTIRRYLANVPFQSGAQNEKLRPSNVALEAIYLPKDAASGGFISAAEASKRLTLAKTKQVSLEMEVTARRRIPVEDIKAMMEEAFNNVAGILKARRGKTLDETTMEDIFGELRGVTKQIDKWTDSAIATLPDADSTPDDSQ